MIDEIDAIAAKNSSLTGDQQLYITRTKRQKNLAEGGYVSQMKQLGF